MLKPWFGCYIISIDSIVKVMDLSLSPLSDRWMLGQPPDLFPQMLDNLIALHGGNSATPLHSLAPDPNTLVPMLAVRQHGAHESRHGPPRC